MAPTARSRLPFQRAQRKLSPPPVESVENKDCKDDSDNNDDLEFFRHTKELFPEVIKETEKAVRAKARKSSDAELPDISAERDDHKRRRLSVGSSDNSDVAVGPRSGSSIKRQSTTSRSSASFTREARVSPTRRSAADNDDDDVIMDVKGKGKEIIHDRAPRTKVLLSRQDSSRRAISLGDLNEDDPVTPSRGAPSQRTLQRSRMTRERTPPLRIYDTDDEDDGDLNYSAARRISSGKKAEEPDAKPAEEDAEEEDDEFDEYVQRARERMEKAKAVEAAGSKEASATPAPEEPMVMMLVVSRIRGTKPLQFRRRITGNMTVVIKSWIAQQRRHGIDVPDEAESTLFLTWNGNKVYGTSTIAALGIRADSTGVVIRKPADHYSAYAEGGGIILEMWTEQLFAEYQKEKERERLQSLGQLDDEPESDADEVAEVRPAQPKRKKKIGIRVIMRDAGEYGELKLTAQPSTQIGVLIDMYRDKREVPDDKDIKLRFDGQTMDPNWEVNDFEDIEHDDTNQFDVVVS